MSSDRQHVPSDSGQLKAKDSSSCKPFH